MRHREFVSRRKAGARLAPVLLVLFALCASLMPASRAQEGRPRRVNAAPRTAVAAQPPQTAQQKSTPPAQTGSRPAQTPTPAPTATPQTTGGRPKLQTQPTAQADQPAAQEDPNQEVNPDEVVRIESNEIKLHVRVVDRFNRPVNDVRQDELKVFENGVQQTITSFTQEEVPITYGLVVDNSGSLRNQINQVIEAAKTIVNSNKPGDETFVVRFISSDEIKIMQDYTADKQSLDDALDDMFVEGGQTAVIDAVYLSAEHAAERRKGETDQDKRRRALILVTDGEDRASFYKQEQLFEALKEEDVQIFVIGFVNELEKDRGFISKSKRQKAMDLLDKMAKETGGRAFYPNSLSELPQIAQDITKDLRTQYVISYVPKPLPRPGEFRPVRVAVADAPGREKRVAVTRSGYTAKGGDAQPSQSPPTVRRQ
ncbi:MAG TPA: VWA domain-containing protein [Pyrinomonadaceae bacterium]|nr:VWA domain-containing protein [Pyrinomonadaceae bacterium]